MSTAFWFLVVVVVVLVLSVVVLYARVVELEDRISSHYHQNISARLDLRSEVFKVELIVHTLASALGYRYVRNHQIPNKWEKFPPAGKKVNP